MGIRSCIFMLCTWVGIAASAQAAPQYRFEPLPVREGLQLWRIGGFNNAGQVAAVWSDRAQPILYEAALYTPGLGHAAIGPRSAGGIGLNGMNASGEVVGSVGHWDALRAWRFTPEATPFGGLAAGVNGLATGVNDAGVVVGSALVAA